MTPTRLNSLKLAYIREVSRITKSNVVFTLGEGHIAKPIHEEVLAPVVYSLAYFHHFTIVIGLSECGSSKPTEQSQHRRNLRSSHPLQPVVYGYPYHHL